MFRRLQTFSIKCNRFFIFALDAQYISEALFYF